MLQLLNNFDGAKRALFEQAATMLAFQQDGASAALIAKDKALSKDQKDRLPSLSRGTCLAIGSLVRGGTVSSQPILLDYRRKSAASEAPRSKQPDGNLYRRKG